MNAISTSSLLNSCFWPILVWFLFHYSINTEVHLIISKFRSPVGITQFLSYLTSQLHFLCWLLPPWNSPCDVTSLNFQFNQRPISWLKTTYRILPALSVLSTLKRILLSQSLPLVILNHSQASNNSFFHPYLIVSRSLYFLFYLENISY